MRVQKAWSGLGHIFSSLGTHTEAGKGDVQGSRPGASWQNPQSHRGGFQVHLFRYHHDPDPDPAAHLWKNWNDWGGEKVAGNLVGEYPETGLIPFARQEGLSSTKWEMVRGALGVGVWDRA